MIRHLRNRYAKKLISTAILLGYFWLSLGAVLGLGLFWQASSAPAVDTNTPPQFRFAERSPAQLIQQGPGRICSRYKN